MAKSDGSIIIDTRINTKGVEEGSARIESSLNKTLSVVKKVGKAIAAAFAIKQVAAFAKECIDLGSDLEEVQNVVDVTFGDMTDIVDEFAKNAATQFGLSELSAKQYTSTIGAMLKSMGFAEDAVTDMSIKMAGLTGDMASFYNLDPDEAFNKIRSGISGETEPLKQLGINLSEANLEQYRLAQGMETAYGKMSQQEKALLRYNYLLSVTSDAQGDFARTSDSWANQLRILKLQFESIKATLGQGFINLFTPILKMINGVLIGVAKLASAFKAFTELITGAKSEAPASNGVDQIAANYSDAADSASDYADATDKSAKVTKKAAKENDKYLSGLDEIHQYQTNKNSDTTSSTSSPKASSSAGSSAVDFGSLAQGETVIDKTAAKMKALYDAIVQGVQPTVAALKKLYDEGLQKVGSFVWTAAQDFYNEFLVPVGKWTLGEGIPRFINALNDGLMKVNWSRINDGLKDLWKQLAPFAINVGEGLLWFWENVLVPLKTWTLNEVVPRFLTMLSAALRIANTVIEAAKPGFQWFWDNVLSPIAKWTGGVFMKIWDGINGLLEKFANWCQNNPQVIENATVAILAFFTAMAGIAVIKSVASMIGKIGEFVSIVKLIVSMLNPWTIAIGAVIAAGVLLWKNWDTISEKAQEIWGSISTFLKQKWEGLKQDASAFIESIKGVFTKGWSLIKTGTTTAWNSIKSGLTSILNGIKSTGTNTISAFGKALSTAWNGMKSTATSVWSGISGVVSGALNGIQSAVTTVGGKISGALGTAFQTAANLIKRPINGILAVVNGLLSGLISGINFCINALNRIKIDIPSWVPVYGGKKFGFNLSTLSIPRIPYLATGAVIPPNAPFTAVLGDQKSGNNIEAPESLLRKIVREESAVKGGSYQFTALINRRELFNEVIKEGQLRKTVSGLNPFELA